MANAVIAINFADSAETQAGASTIKSLNPAVLYTRLNALTANTIIPFTNTQYAALTGCVFAGDVSIANVTARQGLTSNNITVYNGLTASGNIRLGGNILNNINIDGVGLSALRQAFTISRPLSVARLVATNTFSLCDSSNNSNWLIGTAESGGALDLSKNSGNGIRFTGTGQIGVWGTGSLSYGTSGQVLYSQGSGAGAVWGPGGGDLALLRQVQLQNKNGAGGTPVVNTWTKRNINTIVIGAPWLYSLNTTASAFGLAPGTYDLQASAAAHRTNVSRIGLFRESDNTLIQAGLAGYTQDNATYNNDTIYSTLFHRFTLTTNTEFSIRHWITDNTAAGLVFGYPSNITGVDEIYAEVFIRRIG